ncbi:hypothetical protein ACIRG5_12245 [Lentzea sp. NPDC102401]|uniref:hypothetical protein n=1 Tax=Lentzea sp. NPDC102401 TaxID=3364128 RepID=UPI0037F1B96E
MNTITRTHVPSRQNTTSQLLWLAWRQHRATVVWTMTAIGLLGIGMVILSRMLRSPSTAPGELEQLTELANILLIAQILAPVLIATFWTAPAIAREHEQRTAVFVWTQDVKPAAWLTVKVAMLGGLTLVAAAWTGVCSAQLARSIQSVEKSASLFESVLFEASVPIQIGYSLFAFAIGLAASALLRRTVPAIGLSLGVFIAARVVATTSRSEYLPPERLATPFTGDTGVTRAAPIGENSRRLGVEYADASGAPKPFPWTECRSAGTREEFQTCVRGHGVQDVVTVYQPGSRLFLFQVIESSAFTLAAAALITWIFLRFRKRSTVIGKL